MLASTKTKTDALVSRVLQRFNLMPKTSKYLLLAGVVLVFAFVVSTMFLSRSQAQQAERAAFADAARGVEIIRDQVNGAIIYKDENQARELLQQAFAKLAELDADIPEEQAEIERLKNELAAIQNQLRHVVNIPSPPIVADLSSVGVTASAMTRDENDLLVFGSDKSLWRVDPSANAFRRVDVDTGAAGVAHEADREDDDVFVLDDRPGLDIFSEDVWSVTNTQPGENERWVDLYAYADRVYVLNPGGGGTEPQILRFSQTDDGFGTATGWIRARTTDLSDAFSLAVDGTVFVLKQNGTVVRFTSGSEVAWNQGMVDPPLSAPTDLWTEFESAFVYVLEPSTQRLVVYEKESGTFVTQYRSDAFVGLTDFIVDEANKTIYLLAGSVVYRVDASHVK